MSKNSVFGKAIFGEAIFGHGPGVCVVDPYAKLLEYNTATELVRDCDLLGSIRFREQGTMRDKIILIRCD